MFLALFCFGGKFKPVLGMLEGSHMTMRVTCDWQGSCAVISSILRGSVAI